MIGMQYKITLPADFDMNQIVARVRENGHKTDGFDGLLFKCYLIKEKGSYSIENMYAPLYVWETSQGMNKFLFEGYYDNIIRSFGWQQVCVGVPLFVELSEDFDTAKYVVEQTKQIAPQPTLNGIADVIRSNTERDCLGRVCIYNPEKWKYSMYYFYKDIPQDQPELYRILHISK